MSEHQPQPSQQPENQGDPRDPGEPAEPQKPSPAPDLPGDPAELMGLGLPSEAVDPDATSEEKAAHAKGRGEQPQQPATPPGAFIPPSPQELDPLLPQLEVLELLGRGGMGAVYKARQPVLDRLVAVKLLAPHMAASAAFAERFMREARTLAKLSHAHIIAIYDFGKIEAKTGDLYYIVMDYIDGTDLRQVIRGGNLTPESALAIVPQICEALQFAHDEGVVHRDIKPENILIDKKGHVKIADFGLAKLALADPDVYTLTHTGGVMGTPRYMSPEQMEGSHDVDHRADIYSLGVVFYELLTGELPMGRFDPPSKKVQVDVRLDDVVLRTLEREPERRYQQASQIKSDVESISPAQEIEQPPSCQTVDKAANTEPVEIRSDRREQAARCSFLSLLACGIGIALAIACEEGRPMDGHGFDHFLRFMTGLCIGIAVLTGLASYVLGRVALVDRLWRDQKLSDWPKIQANLAPAAGGLTLLFFLLACPIPGFFAIEDGFLDGGTVFFGQAYQGTDLMLWISVSSAFYALLLLILSIVVRHRVSWLKIICQPVLFWLKPQHAKWLGWLVVIAVLNSGLFFKLYLEYRPWRFVKSLLGQWTLV